MPPPPPHLHRHVDIACWRTSAAESLQGWGRSEINPARIWAETGERATEAVPCWADDGSDDSAEAEADGQECSAK